MKNDNKFNSQQRNSEATEKGAKRNSGRRKGKKRNYSNKQGFSTPKREVRDDFTAVGKPHIVAMDSNDANDYSWYNNIKVLKDNAASLPFNVPSGLDQIPVKLGQKNTYDSATELYAYQGSLRSPAIMTFDILPTLGGESDQKETSAPNLAAQQIYTLIRRANSGYVKYDKTDVMMVILAMDNAYMLYEILLRGYKIASSYNTMNRYQPAKLTQALGLNHELIINNLADYRAMLNSFAYQLGSINIPDQFDFIKRHSWLFSNVYKDAPSNRANMVAFKHSYLYQWTEGASADDVPYLKPIDVRPILKDATTINQLQDLINSFMNPILGSQDIGVISGDMAKAFGDGGMIKIQMVAENEWIAPVYNKEVMTQIENMTIYSHLALRFSTTANAPLRNTGAIYTVNDNLVSGPYITQFIPLRTGLGYGLNYMINPILNFHWDNPTSDDVMVATRLTSVVKSITSATDNQMTCGTELCISAQIWAGGSMPDTGTTGPTNPDSSVPYIIGANPNGVGATPQYIQSEVKCNIPDANGENPTLYRNVPDPGLMLINAFDWHPTQYIFGTDIIENTESPGNNKQVDLYVYNNCDLDNYITLDYDTLKRINDVAVMSLYTVKSYSNNS